MLPPPFPLTAAITAGGQSSRFGSDKALAQWQGRALLGHVAASFPPAERRLLIAPVGKYDLAKYDLRGWETVPDLRPECGPLAGLETALTAAGEGWVAFTGVDNPCLTPDYWLTLLTAVQSPAQSVQAIHPERGSQPLGALYHTSVLPHVTALLDSGERRLRLAVPPETTVTVAVADTFFRNVNRAEDLAALG